MPRYDAQRLEPKWQKYWEDNATFRTGPFEAGREKLYVLDMFPYPSGAGLHVGHPEGYTATDILCRYSRMKGKQVLHPMGWDAFGLPAEDYAIKTGTHPAITTAKNIETFRRQLKSLGFSYDWDRELATTDEDYYRWTQWIFLKLFDTWYDPDCVWTGPDGKQRTGRGRPVAELPIPADVQAQGTEAVRRYQDAHRLAYQHEAPVNWCPALGTVLANEEIIDGRSERGGHPVERFPLRQWMLRITSYAERLIDELEDLNWPESIKEMQRNWIGRSTGAEVDFFIGSTPVSPLAPAGRGAGGEGPPAFDAWKAARSASGFPQTPGDDVIRVYTTRPDTLFGVTYMVLAPEHPFVDRLTTPEQRDAVEAYRKQAALKSDLDRTDLAKTKTGVFTGSYAINPVNGEQVPVWIADYVLISYGTGAIMAVPAHDERDFEFAVKFDLPIIPVVLPPADWIETSIGDQFDIRVHRERIDFITRSMDEKGFSAQDVFAVRLATEEHLVRNVKGEGRTAARVADVIVDALIANRGSTENLPGSSFDSSTEEKTREAVALSFKTLWECSSEVAYLTQPKLFSCAYSGIGTAVNSERFNGLPTSEFKAKITEDLSAQGLGRRAVNYRLRDWLFSRQRYWGEPFPIWHELDANGQPTGLMRTDAESELPVKLPSMAEFKPTGTPDPMLSKAPVEWLFKTAADGTKLKRETNTMPQWAGSCWYYIRFVDPKNNQAFIDPQLEKQWLPIDLYVGGAEHAVLHLLYSRFWHKVLFDRGLVSSPEPFRRLVNQGLILGPVQYFIKIKVDAQGNAIEGAFIGSDEADAETEWADKQLTKAEMRGNLLVDSELDRTYGEYEERPVPCEEVIARGGKHFWTHNGVEYEVDGRAEKMSKSRGNVINPDSVVKDYGADALRMYEMFMGPLEQVKPWSMSGVEGVYRFLGRVWRMITDEEADDIRLHSSVQDAAPTADQERLMHRTIKAVTEDIDRLAFNTAISRMMEFVNGMTGADVRPKALMESFVRLLSPFAPHIAEELWQVLGHAQSLVYEPWPVWDEAKLIESEVEVPVQFNGKLRATIKVPVGSDAAAIEAVARSNDRVQENLSGKSIVKVVCVPGRMINFVVK